MRKRLAPIALLAPLTLGLAPLLQETPEPEPVEAALALTPEFAAEIDGMRPRMREIVGEALRSRSAFTRLERLCATAPGRLSGSANAAAAVEWARQELESLPFDEVRLEPITVPHWVRGEFEVVRMAAPEGIAGRELNCLALGGSVATQKGGITAEVLRVEGFDDLASKAAQAKDRIVFFDVPMDRDGRDMFAAYGEAGLIRRRGAIEAAKAGARGVVIRSIASVVDDEPHTGAMSYDERVPKIPAAAISTRDAEWLTKRMADAAPEHGPFRLHLELDCQWLEDKQSFNVVGDYTGSEFPDEIVLVGGHLDSWDVAQGAHDDGAGCTHAIDVVRTLGALGIRPKRTIRVVLFMNEENGLAGGRGYRAAHADEMSKHVLALESDSGGFTPRGFSSNAAPEGFAILERIVAQLDEERCDRLWEGGGGADIGPMSDAGVPLVGFRPDDERYFTYHHTRADTIDAVNERELDLGAGCIAAVIWAVADLSVRFPSNLEAPSGQ